MKKILGTTAAMIAAVAFAGCSAGMSADTDGHSATTPGAGTGSANFDLEIPNGESISTINLHLVCDGIDQHHVLDVVNGEVRAAFGGLGAGSCTATMDAVTPDGTDCLGETTFTVVEDVTTPVTVTLMCQGIADGGNGLVTIQTDFVTKQCDTDRIRKIYAIPSNVLTGESTTVEVETWPGTAVGTPVYSYEVVSDASHDGTGVFAASAACAVDLLNGLSSESCQDFTCGALGATPSIDPATGLSMSSVLIQVTYEDDDCYDIETVSVDCIQASNCGDGVVEGAEVCDGPLSVGPGEECTAGCDLIELCGDGLVNVAGEVCDGAAGVLPNTVCNATCQLEALPFCGDGVINGTDECDGASLPYVGAVCSAACAIVPFCGNGVAEGAEACDGLAGVTPPTTCSATCTVVPFVAPNTCLDCVEGPVSALDPGLASAVIACEADPLCNAVLECLTANDCFDPTAAECYCGNTPVLDTDACALAGYTPTGDCHVVMAAGSGAGATNSDVLDRVFDPAYPAGLAGSLVQAAVQSGVCVAGPNLCSL